MFGGLAAEFVMSHRRLPLQQLIMRLVRNTFYCHQGRRVRLTGTAGTAVMSGALTRLDVEIRHLLKSTSDPCLLLSVCAALNVSPKGQRGSPT